MEPPEARIVDGIKVVSNEGRHGACVSYYNFDALDRKALDFAREFALPRALPVLDAGCSQYAVQALRFAEAGLRVDAVDLLKPVCDLPDNVRFFQADLRTLDAGKLHPQYGLLYAQRVLDLFPFGAARGILHALARRLARQGRVFFSVASLTGPHGAGYADREKPVEQRFCALEDERAGTFELLTPLCLYDDGDFEKLTEGLSLRLVEKFKSSYGTHKVVLEKI